MPTKKPTPAELLALLADRAEGLRKAGVVAVAIDGFHAQFAPWTDPGDGGAAGRTSPSLDPLDDPATYPGGRVPGFEREPDADGDVS